MLTETTTTDTPAIGEDSGVETELIDSSLLIHAAGIAVEAALGLQASREKADWITLFRALAELTCVEAEAGDPSPRFSMSFLQSKCAALDPEGRVYWQSDEDTARKKFTKAWDNLVEVFPRMEANLRQRAGKKRVAARVIPSSRSDELDKRSKLYGFHLLGVALPKPVLMPASLPSEKAQSDGCSIEYIEEMEVYPIPVLRRPLRINVHGWRSLVLVLPPVLTMFVCWFGLWFVWQLWLSELTVRQIFQATAAVVILGGMLAWLVWPLYRLLEDNIILAPGLLQ